MRVRVAPIVSKIFPFFRIGTLLLINIIHVTPSWIRLGPTLGLAPCFPCLRYWALSSFLYNILAPSARAIRIAVPSLSTLCADCHLLTPRVRVLWLPPGTERLPRTSPSRSAPYICRGGRCHTLRCPSIGIDNVLWHSPVPVSSGAASRLTCWCYLTTSRGSSSRLCSSSHD
jgi:hypothetical protein